MTHRSLAAFIPACLSGCVLLLTSFGVQASTPDGCSRPAPGSVVSEPRDLFSRHGILQAQLTYSNFPAADGTEHYCYLSGDGSQAPTLRVRPGDRLILKLRNHLRSSAQPQPNSTMRHAMPATTGACAASQMTPLSTDLHFHGLTVPPVCHQDDVLRTFVRPGSRPFEYRLQIPADEPPGLYWYHPHVHGMTNPQVLGGASGALIVQGIERVNAAVAGLPERVFIIRDQELLHPSASPADAGIVPPPPILRDAEGDILNTGTGGGKPAKDLSINFVPVPYPDYPPAVIQVRPSERQVWRVLNASAVTYLDLQVLVNSVALPLGVISVDGVPVDENGMARNRILWTNHAFLPPGARVEWIFKGVPAGASASLITRSVDTGPAGENDPARPLASIISADRNKAPKLRLAAKPDPLPPSASAWLGDVAPVRTRRLYFSEQPSDPKNPNGPLEYMITEVGHTPSPYDPQQSQPDIVVHQGDVEDWIIENRSKKNCTPFTSIRSTSCSSNSMACRLTNRS